MRPSPLLMVLRRKMRALFRQQFTIAVECLQRLVCLQTRHLVIITLQDMTDALRVPQLHLVRQRTTIVLDHLPPPKTRFSTTSLEGMHQAACLVAVPLL